MKTCLALLSLLLTSTGLTAPAWTWVDENGVRHYSDRPVAGATRIELSGAQVFSRTTPASAPSAGETNSNGTADPAPVYRSLQVASPSQQETLWNIGGMLDVQLQLSPALQPGHRLNVYLDGQRRDLGTTGTQLTIPEVYRGVHTLQAVILDANGTELLRSSPVTFMVRQTSIQNPNNPNASARAN